MNPELKRPHGRSRHWYEDNIKLEVHGVVGYLYNICMDLGWRGCPAHENVVMNVQGR